MLSMKTQSLPVELLRNQFGQALREHVLLAQYTSARIGGPADVLLAVNTIDELASVVQFMWKQDLRFCILGGGSNVLVSDKGIRELVVLNRAKAVRFFSGSIPSVWAESGVVFSNLAHRCASKGLAGIEWASAVPGTVGGAVYGNAGAFGGDMAGSLIQAEIITGSGRERWSVDMLKYEYRSSILKRENLKAVVLSAECKLTNDKKENVTARIERMSADRRATQPPGASMGSMFKNPAGDFAGRLIEAAGLKGKRVGNARISEQHGNFFINLGEATAEDVRLLIEQTRTAVKEKFAVELELEIEWIGEW